MPAAARFVDTHVCPRPITGSSPPVPHGPGKVLSPGSPDVNIGKSPALREGDALVCPLEPAMKNSVKKGSAKVNINGMPAARVGDPTEHGGQLFSGFLTVIIGG